MRLAFVGTVLGAYRHRERINVGRAHKLLGSRNLGVDVLGERVVVALFLGAHVPDLGLHRHAMRMGKLHHFTRAADVFGKLFFRSVDHDGGEPAGNRLFDDRKCDAMVKMKRDGSISALSIEFADQRSFLNI